LQIGGKGAVEAAAVDTQKRDELFRIQQVRRHCDALAGWSLFF